METETVKAILASLEAIRSSISEVQSSLRAGAKNGEPRLESRLSRLETHLEYVEKALQSNIEYSARMTKIEFELAEIRGTLKAVELGPRLQRDGRHSDRARRN